MENWRDIEGYKDFYQASDKGRVRSMPRTTVRKKGRSYMTRGRILRIRDGGRVLLSRLNIQNSFTVFELVSVCFGISTALKTVKE